MIKKCKFEVDITYNSDYFAEAEIRDTIRSAIKELNDEKIKKFGRKIICDPGKINSGCVGSIKNVSFNANDNTIDLVETLVSLSSCMDEDEPSMILPEPKLEELMSEVRSS